MSIGPTGFPDWQPQNDFDSGVFVDELGVGHVGNATYGPFYVGHYEAISGLWKVNTGIIALVFSWYTSSDLTRLTGECVIPFDGATAEPCQLNIPNRGPWCRIQAVPASGGAWTAADLHLYASNRTGRAQLSGGLPDMIDRHAVSVGGALTATWGQTQYHSGPAKLYVNPGGVAGSATLEYIDRNLVWIPFYSVAIAAGGQLRDEVFIPVSAVRLTVLNGGGGPSNFDATLIPCDIIGG